VEMNCTSFLKCSDIDIKTESIGPIGWNAMNMKFRKMNCAREKRVTMEDA
jgi:hypothetical protein